MTPDTDFAEAVRTPGDRRLRRPILFQSDAVSTELRLADSHELFTVPREFLKSLLRQRNEQRLRLRPPYREHLSQSFARFFMRVGLPQAVNPAW